MSAPLLSFAAIPEAAIPRGAARAALEAAWAVSLTATVAVFWEFYEFLCDRAFHTHKQGGNADTMGDLAVGISGSLSYVLVAWRLRKLGRIEPLVRTKV